METTNNFKNTRKVRLEDFICERCHSEATNTSDHVCQLCKALGKGADKDLSEFDLWSFFVPFSAKPESLLSFADSKSSGAVS